MLLVSRIREEKESITKALQKRGIADIEQRLDDAIRLDEMRKSVQTEMDKNLSILNNFSKEIGQLYKTGKRDEAEVMKSKVSEVKEIANKQDDELKQIISDLESLLLTIPNVPNKLVPNGLTEADNEVYQELKTELPKLPENAMPHWELCQKYNLIDFKLGVKITGSGFPLYRGQGARLQRALINFFLDRATQAGYEEVQAPLLVNPESARGTGNLPDKEGQMYHVERDDLYLIPTAELPLTNIVRGDIINKEDLPLKYTGYTPCFRREAGSYGSDVKGLNRLHQFDKIEIVQIQHPNNSYDTLDNMMQHVASLLEELELPYRILRLCGGDLTFASALTYDFEVYSAAQEKWLEVSSVSNFETFQSNRLKLRYRGEDGKTHLAHTLNGSALALPRIVASLLENNQTEDGIRIPKALIPYTGFESIK